jgi:hypothetical protein
VVVEVGEVVHRAKLAVRHVEEVRSPGDRPQRLPGLDVGGGIVRVTVPAAELHGDAAVCRGREHVEQLLEVRAVVLGEAGGDPGRPAPAHPAAPGRAVLARKAHARAVVVQLVELQAEAAAHRDHDLGEQRAPVGVEEAIEGAAYGIVAQLLHLQPCEAEGRRGEGAYGLLLAVDGFALDHDRAQEHPERAGRLDRSALVPTRYVTLQRSRQARKWLTTGRGPRRSVTSVKGERRARWWAPRLSPNVASH